MPPELHRESLAKSLDEADDEYQRMLLALLLYRPRRDVVEAVRAAYNDPSWSWTESDGCTAVSEAHSPKGKKFWPCVMHDHQCELARRAPNWKEHCRIRLGGDNLFYKANVDFGMSRARAYIRYVWVRRAWYLYYRWKEKAERKRQGTM